MNDSDIKYSFFDVNELCGWIRIKLKSQNPFKIRIDELKKEFNFNGDIVHHISELTSKPNSKWGFKMTLHYKDEQTSEFTEVEFLRLEE
jgi:hypothetical protein